MQAHVSHFSEREFTPKTAREAFWEAYEHVCYWCRNPLEYLTFQLDHIIPKRLATLSATERLNALQSMGITHDIDVLSIRNVAPICARENCVKSDQLSPAVAHAWFKRGGMQAEFERCYKHVAARLAAPEVALDDPRLLVSVLTQAAQALASMGSTSGLVLRLPIALDRPRLGWHSVAISPDAWPSLHRIGLHAIVAALTQFKVRVRIDKRAPGCTDMWIGLASGVGLLLRSNEAGTTMTQIYDPSRPLLGLPPITPP